MENGPNAKMGKNGENVENSPRSKMGKNWRKKNQKWNPKKHINIRKLLPRLDLRPPPPDPGTHPLYALYFASKTTPSIKNSGSEASLPGPLPDSSEILYVGFLYVLFSFPVNLADVSDILYFFLLGGGGGSPRRPGGGGVRFLNEIPEEGGGEGEGPRGRESLCDQLGLLGGGLNILFRVPNVHQD